ncbi:hypothetical protein BDN72DRAFT_890884 [Pluteus cervinus]|uniref:Uncharacterized protein n=1 Tax=Pluteus cervinus TaxID=181527 RepID=A0ACD3BGE3_9AGAR|nr:hypothetical protein BDN72DRAFT_890884 [Pluteus cervinus]
MAQVGLLDWANGIRLTMENDPGRQSFQDQVLNHGFSFLEDYLDNILAGGKTDPLIELVKTPGRKKVNKKPKTTSKLNMTITHSLEDEEDEVKEDSMPISVLHQTLLQAKEKELKDLNPSNVLAMQENNSASDDLFTSQESWEPPQPVNPSGFPTKPGASLQACDPHAQKELSMIAEDDEVHEPEESAAQSLLPEEPAAQPETDMVIEEDHQFPVSPRASEGDVSMDITVSGSDTFHSVPLGSPTRDLRDKLPTPDSPPHPPLDVESASTAAVNSDPGSPLPVVPTGQHSSDPIVQPPLIERDSPSHIEVEDPLHDEDSPPTALNAVTSLPSFPSLPGPMPLRKSMRATRDAPTNTASIGAITPGTNLGKRTSWLMKAREVKALELTSKKSIAKLHSPDPAPAPAPSTLKRKSGEMHGLAGATGLEHEERQQKTTKNAGSETVTDKLYLEKLESTTRSDTILLPTQEYLNDQEDLTQGMLHQIKKKVEDLNAKASKGMGKSLGPSAAAAALAEARAAAEARVAERNSQDGSLEPIAQDASDEPASTPAERHIGPSETALNSKFTAHNPASQLHTTDIAVGVNRNSTSTTPPNSPPAHHSTYFPPPIAVASKPVPVFVPPAPANGTKATATSALPLNFQPPKVFSVPASMSLGLAPRLASPSHKAASSQDSQSSMNTKNMPWLRTFEGNEEGMPIAKASQQKVSERLFGNDPDDEDSWPLDERATFHLPWGSQVKEDTSTWSTFPSQSQRGGDNHALQDSDMVTSDLGLARGKDEGNDEVSMDVDDPIEEEPEQDVDSELEDIILQSGKPTVGLVTTKPVTRDSSQASIGFSETSQSQPGILGQAAKLLQSALGTSKKNKPEVKKVLQMAAVAAKKQQEENDKKAARLKEMENRRQAALQRKAEEEKARQHEHERKVKEEGERRKREREEQTDKRPVKPASSIPRKEDDTTKKRKTIAEAEKKPETKKVGPPTAGSAQKAVTKPTLKQPSSSLLSQGVPPPAPSKSTKSSDIKGKAKAPPPEDDLAQPSQLMQTQMAARAKAQLQAVKPPSESIELPDINSEYSDSEDEDRPRTFDPPTWAQSPELRQTLEFQSTINPDEIFGPIRPLRMEEMFKNRNSRFRSRTSSANWNGADRLTQEEEQEYARRMGFK